MIRIDTPVTLVTLQALLDDIYLKLDQSTPQKIINGELPLPQLSTDPVSPDTETAWVLKTVTIGAGGGILQGFLGLGFPYLTVGVGGSTAYEFKYRTIEGTTKKVALT